MAAVQPYKKRAAHEERLQHQRLLLSQQRRIGVRTIAPLLSHTRSVRSSPAKRGQAKAAKRHAQERSRRRAFGTAKGKPEDVRERAMKRPKAYRVLKSRTWCVLGRGLRDAKEVDDAAYALVRR